MHYLPRLYKCHLWSRLFFLTTLGGRITHHCLSTCILMTDRNVVESHVLHRLDPTTMMEQLAICCFDVHARRH